MRSAPLRPPPPPALSTPARAPTVKWHLPHLLSPIALARTPPLAMSCAPPACSIGCSRSKVYPPNHSRPSPVNFKIYMCVAPAVPAVPSVPVAALGALPADLAAHPPHLAPCPHALLLDCHRTSAPYPLACLPARPPAHLPDLHCRYELNTQLAYDFAYHAGWLQHDNNYIAYQKVGRVGGRVGGRAGGRVEGV